MTIRNLKDNIAAKTFAKLYLFCGEETFLIRRYLNNVKSSALPDMFKEFNLFEFDGENNVEVIKDAIEQFPQMSNKKLIIIKNSGLLKAVSKPIENLLQNIPNDTIVIFVEDDIKKVSKPLLKIFESEGEIIEFKRQSKSDLCKWVNQLFATEGKKVSSELSDFLVTVCDNNMERIYQEVQKLISSTENDELKEELTRQLVSVPVEYKIFDMMDKLLAKDANASYKLLQEFKQNKEEPTVVISLIFAQVYSLAQVRDLIEERHPKIDEFLPANRKWMARKLAALAPKYKKTELDNIMTLCLNYDYAIKTGEIDGFVALEIIIATLLKSSQNSHQSA